MACAALAGQEPVSEILGSTEGKEAVNLTFPLVSETLIVSAPAAYFHKFMRLGVACVWPWGNTKSLRIPQNQKRLLGVRYAVLGAWSVGFAM